MKPLLSLCFFAVTLVQLAAASAQSPTVTSKLLAQRVQVVEGKTVFQPSAEGKPGDVIEYSGIYSNGGAAPVDKLQATVPVPAGTTFIAGSAQPTQAQASTDGVRFAPIPLMRMSRQLDGSERREAVPLTEYRALRWEVGTLAAGRSTGVTLRVRIDSPVANAAAKPDTSIPLR